MCHDMIEVEKMGKPAVPIVSGRFEDDAIASSRTFGMPDLQFVIVPRIYRNLADDLCVSQTEDVIDDLIGTLTTEGDQASQNLNDESTLRFEGEDRYDAVQKMNQEFTARDWSDALPILPPTREAVDKLIAGTKLNADDVVFSTHRGHGHALAKGMPPRELVAELYGRETGCSQGRGGSTVSYTHLTLPAMLLV